MVELERPGEKTKLSESPPRQDEGKKALSELSRRATKSNRYERRDVKREKETAEKVFKQLRDGNTPTLDIKAMSDADITAAKAIISDMKQAQKLEWLTEGAPIENPVVADILARIASAPEDLQNNPKWLIAQALELREAQRGTMPDELKFAIQKVSNRIKDRVVELTGISEEDRHAIFTKTYDPDKLSSVAPDEAEVVEIAEFCLSEIGSPPRVRRGGPSSRGGAPPPPRPLSEKSKWIYDPPTDRVTNPALKSALEQLNKEFGDVNYYDNLNNAFNVLNELESQHVATATELKPFKDRVEYDYMVLKGQSFELTPEIIKQLSDPEKRDELFYQRIAVVLNNPNQQSRELMDLYQTNYLNTFMHAVGQMKDGGKLINHFTTLKEAVFALHDLDFQARSSAGDVESFQKAATYFKNEYAQEALCDPLVVSMLQSYEQALKMIRDNNDGYIPPSLVSYDPTRYVNYWDELALKIFEEKVKAGLIYDAAIETTGPNKGLRKKDPTGRVFARGKQLSETDIKNQALRIKASMRMAKGTGILNMRWLEIFAFSKTPGYENPDFGTDKLVFSSKAYEGLARWFNPMGDWFGKYKMGKTMWAPFFATLIGLDHNAAKDFLTWDQYQWEKVHHMAKNGELHDWIQAKYGKKAGRLLDLVSEFAFSGRWGPLSGWGEHDATVGFSDFDHEREGGSMRLFQAEGWASRNVKAEYLAFHAGAQESDWIKWKNTEEAREKIATYAKAYKTHIWVQTVMRSPTIVAGFARVPSETYQYMHENKPKLLRSVIIKRILGNTYDIEANVASEATPTTQKRTLMERIELLENDVMLVQQKALTGGRDQRPRDIVDSDMNVIHGTKNGVSEAIRRRQAKEYITQVRSYMLGTKSASQWESDLGMHLDASNNVVIDHMGNIKAILASMPGSPLLTEELIDKKIPIHMGMEDVQWQYLDLQALGERSWNRRASDLMARASAIVAMQKLLSHLRPKPNLEELGKDMEEIYNQEQNHFPMESEKFTYLMAKAVGEVNRQTAWAKIPFLGRIVSRLKPSSINQQVHGVEHGAAWSANNERQWVGIVQQATGLPLKEIDPNGEYHPYNIHKLEKDLNATRGVAIAEMIGLGVFIASAATILAAFTKGTEEDK